MLIKVGMTEDETLVLVHTGGGGRHAPLSPLGRRRISQVLERAASTRSVEGAIATDGEAVDDETGGATPDAAGHAPAVGAVARRLALDFGGWVSRGVFVLKKAARQAPSTTE